MVPRELEVREEDKMADPSARLLDGGILLQIYLHSLSMVWYFPENTAAVSSAPEHSSFTSF